MGGSERVGAGGHGPPWFLFALVFINVIFVSHLAGRQSVRQKRPRHSAPPATNQEPILSYATLKNILTSRASVRGPHSGHAGDMNRLLSSS